MHYIHGRGGGEYFGRIVHHSRRENQAGGLESWDEANLALLNRNSPSERSLASLVSIVESSFWASFIRGGGDDDGDDDDDDDLHLLDEHWDIF